MQDGGQTQFLRFGAHGAELVGGGNHQLAHLADAVQHHQVAQIADPLGTQALHILGGAVEGIHQRQGGGSILRRYAIGELSQGVLTRHAGDGGDGVHIDVLCHAGALIQQRQTVAQSAVCQTSQQHGGIVGDGEPLLACHVGQAGGNLLGADATKVEPLATGEDGGGQFMHLGGGEDENHVGRRLFQRLEQGIKRTGGQHVHLVDDVHAVGAADGGECHLVTQVADGVHAVVGGGVDLGDVQDGAVVDATADGALVAGVAVHGMLTVHRLGQDFGAGGLARTTATRK